MCCKYNDQYDGIRFINRGVCYLHSSNVVEEQLPIYMVGSWNSRFANREFIIIFDL